MTHVQYRNGRAITFDLSATRLVIANDVFISSKGFFFFWRVQTYYAHRIAYTPCYERVCVI